MIGGFLLFFLLFASYFMLRPVRETFGIAGGVDNLQWLFLGTFLATLVVVPLYGALAARLPRRSLLPVTYIVSALVMFGFAIGLLTDPENVWVARAFYIWLSVFNLFVISLAWSLMADIFSVDQGRRLFGQIAAGASVGGLTGPLLSPFLVAPLGHAGLLMLSTVLLLATLACARYLMKWQERHGEHDPARTSTGASMGGSIWAGITLILRSPYLIAISIFVILFTSVSTFLYFEQARVVEATFHRQGAADPGVRRDRRRRPVAHRAYPDLLHRAARAPAGRDGASDRGAGDDDVSVSACSRWSRPSPCWRR